MANTHQIIEVTIKTEISDDGDHAGGGVDGKVDGRRSKAEHKTSLEVLWLRRNLEDGAADWLELGDGDAVRGVGKRRRQVLTVDGDQHRCRITLDWDTIVAHVDAKL